MAAPGGNKNARKGNHDRVLVSISGSTLDLIYDALALQGNYTPSKEEIRDAVKEAVTQVFQRTVEDANNAIIL